MEICPNHLLSQSECTLITELSNPLVDIKQKALKKNKKDDIFTRLSRNQSVDYNNNKNVEKSSSFKFNVFKESKKQGDLANEYKNMKAKKYGTQK